MVRRKKHKRLRVWSRRMGADWFEPSVTVGPLIRHLGLALSPACRDWNDWRREDDDDRLRRRRINGRRLSGRLASHVQWGSAIAGHVRRRDRRDVMHERMGQRALMWRYTSVPF